MKTVTNRVNGSVRNRVLPSLLLAVLLGGMSLTAVAQEKKERKATGTLTEATFRQLERAQNLMGENKNAEALEILNKLEARLSNDYEKALVLQTKGFLYASKGDYKRAIPPFEDAVALDALPQQPYEQMLLTLGQLLYSDGQMDKAITRLEQYIRDAVTSEPPADAHIMLASAYVEKKQFAKALPHVDAAIAKGKPVKESWYQLKLAIHYELKQFPQCAQTLVQLIGIAPDKKDYWKQLSSILFEIKRDQESLAVLAIAARKGHLTEEREIRNLANIYMLLEIPFKAGEVLEDGLARKILPEDERTLSILSDAWIMAREYGKAEAVLQRAAQVSNKGELWFRLAQIHVEEGEWNKALEALGRATEKGVTKPGEAAFLTGVAAYESGKTDRAKAALKEAMKFDDTRRNARDWLAHIEQIEAEAQAAAALAASLAASESEDDGS